MEEFAKKFAYSLVSITIALVVIFFILGFLNSRFSGNIVGQTADAIGKRASGSAYNF
jgi:hypothetical protein